ncbi:unnamed protein product [Closterium sp. Yama58-4]|nr:unnamed protein product [Closterium sp. Yama58-4]
MHHPLRDLPRLLVRFGAIPKPLDKSSAALEWEEWPQGDEAAAKFPVNRKERCFGLGIVEKHGEGAEKLTQHPPCDTSEAGRRGRHAKEEEFNAVGQESGKEVVQRIARGVLETEGGGRSARRKVAKAAKKGGWAEAIESSVREKAEELQTVEQRATMLPPPRRKLPIVRCRADVDFLVGFAGYIMDPPACTQCSICFGDFMQSVCTAALLANFAYRPVSHLFSRVLSVFPPSSRGFDEVVECLDFPPARLPKPLNLHMLLRRAEQVPLYFLIRVAERFAHLLLGADDEFEEECSVRGRAGRSKVQGCWYDEADQENGGEVWEEVRMWFSAAIAAWRFYVGSEGESEECRGSRDGERRAEEWDMRWVYEAAIASRCCWGSRATALPPLL